MSNWKLQIGIHRGTSASRDSGVVTSKFDDPKSPLNSLEEVIDCAKAWRETYRQTGYLIWFANAVSPTGEKHTSIIPADPYRS